MLMTPFSRNHGAKVGILWESAKKNGKKLTAETKKSAKS